MLLPGTQVGRYVVKRKLAEGGMAEIFLASARGPEGFAKDVVLKVVHSFLAADKQFVDMFIDEARLASRLNHANIVQIFDFGKHEERYYLAMEYVRGGSLWELRRRCREAGAPFPPLLAAEIATQVARGLHYAHSLTERGVPVGLVHRDVTPHNVLLSFDGAVKLTDFGIAKASSGQTQPGTLKGKFAYMSPEQARGESVDLRTDVFALGIVLWELLTGGRLFEADTELGILRAVQESVIAPPSRLNTDVPQELSDLVLKALSRSPPERFQSAFELERALATFVLTHAQAVEDTSVALFLQQMMPEEHAGEGTPVGTPAASPRATPADLSDEHELAFGATARVDRASRGVVPQHTHTVPAADTDPDGLQPPGDARTEEHAPAEGTRHTGTEQMPGLRPSRRLPGPAAPPAPAPGRPRTEEQPRLRPSRRLPPAVPDPSAQPSPTEAPAGAAAGPRVEPTVAEIVHTDPSVPAVEDLPAEAVVRRSPRLALAVGLGATAVAVAAVAAWYAVGTSVPERAPELTASLTRSEPPPSAAPPGLEAPAALPDAGAEQVEPDAGEAPQASPPSPRPTATRPAAHVEAPRADVPPRDPGRAVKPGTLEVRARPYATMVLDGRPLGEVERPQRLSLKPGAHKLTLRHPRLTRDYDVVIRSGEVTPISFEAPISP